MVLPFRFRNLITLVLLTMIGIYMSHTHTFTTPDGRWYTDKVGCYRDIHEEGAR